MGIGARDLAQELTDHIIGYLADDVATLSACSLVCKHWSAPSSRLLFHTLSVPWEQLARLSASIDRLDRLRGAARELVLGCPDHNTAEECNCERAARMTRDDLSPGYPGHPTPATPVHLKHLIKLLSLLPRLDTATLFGLELGRVAVGDVSQIASAGLRLRKLALVDVRRMPLYPAASAYLFSAFQAIGELEILVGAYDTESPLGDYYDDAPGHDTDGEYEDGEDEEGEDADAADWGIAIDSLVVAGPTVAVLALLQPLYRPAALTRLDLSVKACCFHHDLDLLRQFVEYSDALEELRLRVPIGLWEHQRVLDVALGKPNHHLHRMHERNQHAHAHPLASARPAFTLPDLSAHSKLHTVHIHGLVLREPALDTAHSQPHGVWAALVKMLASAASTLHVVGIHARADGLGLPEADRVELDGAYDWAVLGRALGACCGLRRVALLLDPREEEDAAALAGAEAWVEVAERVSGALPSTVRAKLVCGVWDGDMTYVSG